MRIRTPRSAGQSSKADPYSDGGGTWVYSVNRDGSPIAERIMGELFTRKSLYELVWSEPLRTVCTRFGISDVALSNTCRRAMIPTPERGYWARKEAGKSTSVRQLPERAPAMDDEVQVRSKPGYISHALTEQELLGPLPNPPQFEKTLDSVRAQLIATVGKVKVPRELTYSHPAILRLLKEDEQRREKEKASGYVVSWDRPQFDGLLPGEGFKF